MEPRKQATGAKSALTPGTPRVAARMTMPRWFVLLTSVRARQIKIGFGERLHIEWDTS